MSQSLTLYGEPILFSVEQNEDRKQWIHLVPADTAKPIDGRDVSYVKDPQKIIKTSFAQAKGTHGTLPIDYEHGIDLASPKGQPAIAAGWISKMQVRKDGIWGLAEWTPKAFSHIKDREYRFLSPVLLIDRNTKEIQSIPRASLTNNPALPLVSLNSAQKEEIMQTNEQFIIALRQELELDAKANEQTILDKIKSIIEENKLETNKNTIDPAAYVPLELFQNTLNELNRVTAGISREAAEREVGKAIQEMRIFPFMKEWAVELCTINKPAFDNFLNGVSKNIYALETMSKGSPFKDYNPDHSKKPQQSLDKIIASNLGLTDSDLEQFNS